MEQQILIADSQKKFLDTTVTQLRKRGYECVSASDSHITADMLRKAHYKLLIVDATFVETFPSELLADLIHSGKQLTIILAESSLPIGQAVNSLWLPAVAYLIKPVRFDDLLIEIRKALHGPPIPPLLGRYLANAPNDRGGKIIAPSNPDASKLDAHFPDLLKYFCNVVETIKQQLETLILHVSLPPLTNHPPFSELHSSVDNSEPDTWSPASLEDLKQLTPREQEILQLLFTHHRVPAIAQMLYISPHTVRNHLKSIYRKLNVKSQVELMMQVGQKSLQ